MKTEAFPITEPREARARRRGRPSGPRLGRFEHTAVTPLDIRRAVRALGDGPGARDRLVGFAALAPAPDANRTAASLVISATPGIGQLVMLVEAMRVAGARRLYVLTDRRLLVMQTDKRGRSEERAVEADIPIGALEVRALGLGLRSPRGLSKRYALSAPGWPERRVMFDGHNGNDRAAGGARRLQEAFWHLSRDLEERDERARRRPTDKPAPRRPRNEIEAMLDEEFGPPADGTRGDGRL